MGGGEDVGLALNNGIMYRPSLQGTRIYMPIVFGGGGSPLSLN